MFRDFNVSFSLDFISSRQRHCTADGMISIFIVDILILRECLFRRGLCMRYEA